MSAKDIDAYLRTVDQPKRATLEEMRRRILEVVPEADQLIAWGMPAFKVNGKYVAGFAAFKNHLSYFPYSGSVFEELADDLANYSYSKGALRFAIDKPLPKALVRTMIRITRRQAGV